MSVKFIMGLTGEERSKKIYERAIRAAQDKSKKIYVIVPEQYTLDTQKGLINAHPRHALLNIDVVSFNRLAYKVFSRIGGCNIPIIRDSGKNMIIRKVLKDNESLLEFYDLRTGRKGLISEMKSVISELDQYGIGEKELENLTEDFENEKADRTAKKLKDIKLIFREFHKEIKNRFLTQEELLEVLKRRLDETNFLKDSIIFLDGFTGFTTIQYRLIQTFIRQSSDVEISVIYDSEVPRSSESSAESGNLFFMSDDMMNRVTDAASSVNKKTQGHIFCDETSSDKLSKEMFFLKKNFLRSNTVPDVYKETTNGIKIWEAADAREEISLIINEIYKLTRSEGIRYRDIAIVTHDMNKYADMASKLIERSGFPVFLDKRKKVSENPYIENIRALFQIIIKGWTYENIFRLIKTGFSGMDTEKTDLMDNYCLAVGVNTKNKWQNPWTLQAKKIKKSTDGIRMPFYDLEELNSYRGKIVSLISEQETKIKKAVNVSEIIKVLKNYLSNDLFLQRLETEEDNSELKRVALKVEEILNETDELFGNEKADTYEFAEILNAAFEEMSLGFIPPTVDCISIGDINRTRLTDIKVLFALGVNDGDFPPKNSDSGLLTQAERLKIAQKNIVLSPLIRQQAFIQRFYLYLLFSKPFQKLYISYTRKDFDGNSISPSFIIKDILDLFPRVKIEGADINTKNNADIWLPESNVLWEEKRIPIILSESVAEKLYGGELKGSISSFEKYAGCPFSYLMSAGLRFEPRERYTFNPADFGSVVHEILKNVISECVRDNRPIYSLSEEQLRKTVNEKTQQAQESYYILKEGGRKGFIKQRIGELALTSTQIIGKQLQKGDFRPDLLEYAFRIERNLSKDKKLIFNGIIDRVDIANDNDDIYVRVIDYKTGNYDFDLRKAYYGTQTQLINYMTAALETEKRIQKTKNVIPAGMLYYNISNPLVKEDDKTFDEEGIEKEILKELSMKGAVSTDDKSVLLMDKDKTGEVAESIKFDKTGELKAKKNTFKYSDIEALAKFETEKMNAMAAEIFEGNASIKPLIDHKEPDNCICTYCDYIDICNFSKEIHSVRHMKSLSEDEIWAMIKNGEKR